MDLPGYDAWKTTPPYVADCPTCCDACGYSVEDGEDGIECPDCEQGIMEYVEPAEPCFCSGDCYC